MTTDTVPIPERSDRLYFILAPFQKDDEPLGPHTGVLWKSAPLTYHNYIDIPNMASADELLLWLSDEKNHGKASPLKWAARPEYIEGINEDFMFYRRNMVDRPEAAHCLTHRGRSDHNVFSRLQVTERPHVDRTQGRSFVAIIEGDFLVSHVQGPNGVYECTGSHPYTGDILRIMDIQDVRQRDDLLWLKVFLDKLNNKPA